jgi:prepilin-type N-terminal cleavage/methylation domain-containing protein
MYKRSADSQGFTLIELIVVILVIAILMGLVFTAGQGALDRARKTQARNDLTQIVTAVNAYYTEYGRNPINLTFGAVDVEYGNPDSPLHPNSDVMNALRAIADSGPNSGNALNPRKIVFFQGVLVKDASHPRGGFDTNGEFWDPWGSSTDGSDKKGHYVINLDGDYDSYTQAYTLNYSDLIYQNVNNGNAVQASVIAASLGKDRSYGKLPSGGTAPTGDYKYKGSDDILSWQ